VGGGGQEFQAPTQKNECSLRCAVLAAAAARDARAAAGTCVSQREHVRHCAPSAASFPCVEATTASNTNEARTLTLVTPGDPGRDMPARRREACRGPVLAPARGTAAQRGHVLPRQRSGVTRGTRQHVSSLLRVAVAQGALLRPPDAFPCVHGHVGDK
jgi:hypothetical protein